jgi:hypothetical protein
VVTEPEDRILRATGVAQEIEDGVLAELAAHSGPRPPRRGRSDDSVTRSLSPRAPFNLAIRTPQAIDLRRLWKLAKQEPDPTIAAGLGRKRPVLVSHGLTALPLAGQRPARVWGMGYKVVLFGVAADTVAVQPSTELVSIAEVGTDATIELGLDGSLEVPSAMRAALSAVPGVSLSDARVGASVDAKGKLAISFKVWMPRIVSGPGDGSGGAEWALYAQDRALAGYQMLLQTLLVPKSVTRLEFGVTGWVREAGWFGRPKEWTFESATFALDLER